MTGLAHIRGIDVAARQAVTASARATALYLVVIHRNHWCPGRTRMTSPAHIRGIDMRCIPACGNHTIVTGFTNTRHLNMVYRGDR